MEDYDVAMSRAVEHFKTQGVTRFIFGDIFLHECAQIPGAATLAARNRNRGTALGKIFGRGDERFPRIGISDGRRNHDGRRTRRRRHRPGDRPRLHSLSAAGVDPNGENGEYHTFCYDGPIFRQPVPFRLGRSFSQSYDIRLDDGTVKTYSYWFADLQALNTNSDAGTGPASE